MEKELSDIKFKYNFRDYQQEALQMLEKYIHDEKIHVVAAPGAGKTILALELLLRIGNKALILVPTIAIKEQWIERLKKDFINVDKAGLISSDLNTPAAITVITYQYLYSLNRKNINLKEIIEKNNIKTIILDEAHHLRKAWQKTLKQIVEKLKDTTTISLTATPPYDNGNDFANYMDLCGEIDAKITIPQLVKSNCLCPHQDYIYFNVPTEEEELKLFEFNKNINSLVEKIKNNKEFIKCISLHEFIISPEENINNILNKFDLYISMLSFLKEINCEILINSINKEIRVPSFSKEMMQIILQEFIFEKETTEVEIFKDAIDEIKKELRDLKCIDENNNINLKYNKEISDLLIKNSGKLDSISNIIKIEEAALKEKLKLVVITDYIKDEYYDIEDEKQIKEIGIMPIFRKLISENPDINIAVLTGTWVIIPTQFKEKLIKLAQDEYQINEDEIKITELGIDFNYSKVSIENKYDKYIVNLITKLFEQADISVLIGTVALIGEGWDAPFVNSLIMATVVASYVTSNQVRGRTIRKDKMNLKKVSNIWHLVCIEKENKNYILGHDFEILSKRFLAFEGLNIDYKKIDTGIDRLNLKNSKYTKLEIEELNKKMILKARDREKIKSAWEMALAEYIPTCTDKIPQERIYKNKKDKIIRKTSGYFSNTLKILSAIFLCYLYVSILKFLILTNSVYSWGIIITLIFGTFAFLNPSKLNNRITFSQSYESFVRKICKATYKSLVQTNKIESKTKYFIEVKKSNIVYGLKNGSTYEQMIYLKAIKQAIKLDENSRYIIKSHNNTCSVPDIFAKNKKEATIFFNNFNSISKKLIFTKSDNGRKELLKGKIRDLKRIN